MQKFDYEVSIMAQSQNDADTKLKALLSILPKLSTEELVKISKVVNNPVQLAAIKAKLL